MKSAISSPINHAAVAAHFDPARSGGPGLDKSTRARLSGGNLDNLTNPPNHLRPYTGSWPRQIITGSES